MTVVFFNDQEFIVCEGADEDRVSADFFKTRHRDRFTRVIVGDFLYGRVSAPQFKSLAGTVGGTSYGAPSLVVTSNLSDHKL